MSTKNYTIRLEQEEDHSAVEHLVRESFWNVYRPVRDGATAAIAGIIARCTPWCNTHEPHAALSPGKMGFAVALRTGPGMKECERIIGIIEHFYGHLKIQCRGHLGLTGVEYRAAVEKRQRRSKLSAGRSRRRQKTDET